MNKPKHTPGPWIIGKPAPDMHTRCAIRDTQGWEIAEIPGLTIDQEHIRQDANARLIAAAPELLEALEAMVTVYAPITLVRHDNDALGRACAVIAKAKGE